MISNIKLEFSFLPKSKIKAGNGQQCGKYPFFTSSDIKQLFLDEYLFDDELIIIGTGGKPSCNYYNGKFSCSTDNFILKTKGRIKPKYLYYYLRKNNLFVLQKGFHGAGLQHIGKDYLEAVKIEMKPESYQTNVINALDNITKIIKKKQLEKVYLEELIKSRFMCQEVVA